MLSTLLRGIKEQTANHIYIPEGCPAGDEKASLVELPDAVVLHRVPVPHRQREVVAPRLRVPGSRQPQLKYIICISKLGTNQAINQIEKVNGIYYYYYLIKKFHKILLSQKAIDQIFYYLTKSMESIGKELRFYCNVGC